MFDWEGWELVAPGAIAHSDRMPTPRAFSHAEIPTLVGHWGEAAARA
jgi:2,4-dienoyl-CoA reductase-like NADH-dependent reductase (Old Yellow Enzyme family)